MIFNFLKYISEQCIKIEKTFSLITDEKKNYESFILNLNKIINQINTVFNIKNYEIQLNDDLFFEILNNYVNLISNEIISIPNQKNNIKNQNDGIFNDYAEIKKNNFNLEKEIKKLKKENLDLNNKNINLQNQNNQNEKFLNSYNSSKKKIINLINSFTKIFPDKNISKLMMDLINLNELITNDIFNRDIINDKINILNIDFDKNSNDLKKIIYKEIESLKTLLNDYEKNIKEKEKKFDKIYDEYKNEEKNFNNNYKEYNEENNKIKLENNILKNKIKDLNELIEMLNKKRSITIQTNFSNYNGEDKKENDGLIVNRKFDLDFNMENQEVISEDN